MFNIVLFWKERKKCLKEKAEADERCAISINSQFDAQNFTHGSLLRKVYHWQSPHLKSHMLLTFINLVILAVQIYQINNKATAASVLWSVLTRFLRIAIICFQIVVFHEWPFVTWLQAGVDWVLIIFEIMSETVRNCFMTWTKKKTYSSWLVMSPIVKHLHIIFWGERVLTHGVHSRLYNWWEQMRTFSMFRTIFSWITTYTALFSAVYHYYWILMLFLCQSVGQILVPTTLVSHWLVATLMFIKSPRTTFFRERRTEVLAFHAQLARFVIFIAYGAY